MKQYDPDQVLLELRDRLRGLGGGRMAAAVLGAFLLIWLWSTWFTVQPEETGIVQRFGVVVRTVGPGLHFKLPNGIERVRLVPTARVLKGEFGFQTSATGPSQRTQYRDS